MGKIIVHTPVEPEPRVSNFVLAPRTPLPANPTIGVIANGKPLAKELLDALVAELNLPDLNVESLVKPSAAYVISAEQADVMAVRAHVVISGLGD